MQRLVVLVPCFTVLHVILSIVNSVAYVQFWTPALYHNLSVCYCFQWLKILLIHNSILHFSLTIGNFSKLLICINHSVFILWQYLQQNWAYIYHCSHPLVCFCSQFLLNWVSADTIHSIIVISNCLIKLHLLYQ